MKNIIDLLLVKKEIMRFVQEGDEASQIIMLYYVKSDWWDIDKKERGSEWS